MHAKFYRLLSLLLVSISLLSPSSQFTIRSDASQDHILDTVGDSTSSSSDGNGKSTPSRDNAFEIQLNTAGGAWVGALNVAGTQYTVNYDTGSSVIVVPTKDCAGCPDTWPGFVAGSQKPLAPAQIPYGSGVANGNFYVGSAIIEKNGANPVTNFLFLAANVVPKVWLTNGLQGVVGMSAGVVDARVPLYFQSLFDQYSTKLLRKFSFKPTSTGAVLTVGGDYLEQDLSKLNTLKVIANSVLWTVSLGSVRFQDDAAGVNYGSTTVVLDTGNALIQAPGNDNLEKIQLKLGGSTIDSQGIHDVPCDKVPDLVIRFGDDNSHDFVIPADNIRVPENDPGNCRVLIGSRNADGDHWTLGVPFLKTVYSQFNVPTTGTVAGYTVRLAPVTAT